jgi:hypothetical protein
MVGIREIEGNGNQRRYCGIAGTGSASNVISRIPMVDGLWPVLPRHTQPEPEVQTVMEKIRITVPPQPPPRIKSLQLPGAARNQCGVRIHAMEGRASI